MHETDLDLEQVLGPTAMREYRNAEDWDQAKIRQWAARLQSMPDSEFVSECASKVLDSALVMSFKGNWEGTHARASACWHEAARRHRAAGHDSFCHGDTLYSDGHNRAVVSQGHSPSPVSACTCEKSTSGQNAN
ncbi:hypothetical protein ACFYMW_25240 [Streptomyces sp. NPDC006692]|uniref:hypothetical protein n=1 Tax=unclassified Streptomyces TaxID=2593676 RepID=UPI00343D159D